MKPLHRVKIAWSPEFAYAIGLIATDGNLSPDGRHISFTSKDRELAELFRQCLGLRVRIGRKGRGGGGPKRYFVVQFGDVRFYGFLQSIGLHPRKSLTLGEIAVPDKFFLHFLRGCFDGDGTSYSYWDPRWRSSFMIYMSFVSASRKHIDWLRRRIYDRLSISGHVATSGRTHVHACYHLRYAKRESITLARAIYRRSRDLCLLRKRLKIKRALFILGVGLR